MEFELEVWKGGYPVWIHIRYGENEFKFTHRELLELEQIIERAKRDVLCGLPKCYWHEVSADFAGREE